MTFSKNTKAFIDLKMRQRMFLPMTFKCKHKYFDLSYHINLTKELGTIQLFFCHAYCIYVRCLWWTQEKKKIIGPCQVHQVHILFQPLFWHSSPAWSPYYKSDNLQYNTLVCWTDWTNNSTTKCLMFQVSNSIFIFVIV